MQLSLHLRANWAKWATNAIVVIGAIAMVGSFFNLRGQIIQSHSTVLEGFALDNPIANAGHLIWVFQPEDCGQSQTVLDVLNVAHQSGRSVSGFIGVKNSSTVQNVRIAFRIGIPLTVVEPGDMARLLLGLGYKSSPVLLELDAYGRIRRAAPSSSAAAVAREWLAQDKSN